MKEVFKELNSFVVDKEVNYCYFFPDHFKSIKAVRRVPDDNSKQTSMFFFHRFYFVVECLF